MRIFVAMKLPDTVINTIGRVQEKLAGHRLKVRWVKAENVHLTLKFLGDVDAHLFDDIAASVTEAVDGMAPFHLSVKGSGVFPNIRRARVIWLGVSGQVAALNELQKSVEKKLSGIGFPRARRRFTGHLTLGRSKGAIDASRLSMALDECRTFESETFIIDKVIIFKSDLKSTGAVYTKLRTVSLAPRLLHR